MENVGMVTCLKVQRSCLFVFLIGVFLLSGCVSNDEFDETTKNLSQSNEKVVKLEDEIKKTTKDLSESLDKIAKLESELDSLKNGAQMSIIEIRKHHAANNLDMVIELSGKLNEKFPGTPEDIEAQTLVKEIQDIRDKEAIRIKKEQEKILAEQNKSAKEKVRSILRISKLFASKPNSANGVDLNIYWKNNSDKVIKYIVFQVEAYNAVNDIVFSEIGSHSKYNAQDTGPYKKGEGESGDSYWENAWYNSTIKSVKLTNVDIEYMDGTKINITKDDLEHIRY